MRTETFKGYGVLVTRKNGTSFLAYGKESGRYFSGDHKTAVAYKKELQPLVKPSKCKVVRVNVTYEFE